MGVNRYLEHIVVLPEDDEDKALALGFVLCSEVNANKIDIWHSCGGWPKVFASINIDGECYKYLKKYPTAKAILLVDFDGKLQDRRATFESVLGDDENLKDRVYLVGPKNEPQDIRIECNFSMSLEKIGEKLANDCIHNDSSELLKLEQLSHNRNEVDKADSHLKCNTVKNCTRC